MRTQHVRRQRRQRRRASLLTDLVALAAVAVTVGIVLTLVYAPWGRLGLPMHYAGDDLLQALWAKNIARGGDYARSDLLGAPFGQVLHDFPQGADRLTLLMVGALAWLGIDDPFHLVNLVFLADFFLLAGLAYGALRYLRASRLAAGVAAVIVTFLPYHFAHGTAHLFLSAYFAAPLIVLLCVWLARDQAPRRPSAPPAPPAPPARSARSAPQAPSVGRRSPARRRLLLVGAAVVALGWSGPYYAAFAVLIVVGVGIVLAVAHASWRPALAGGILALGILSATVVALAPDLWWIANHGWNDEVLRREPLESDVYGLRFTQLVAPGADHRLGGLAELGSTARDTLVRNEDNGSLGFAVLGGLGFVVVAALRLAAGRRTAQIGVGVPGVVAVTLALVAGLAFLIGTVGGVGFLVAVLGFTKLRVWGRLAVVIGFVGACGVAWAIDAAQRRAGPARARRVPVLGLVALLGVVALVDQVPSSGPDWEASAAIRANDRAFVAGMEASLPPGSAVFQLPVVDFPESPLVGGLEHYESLRPFLAGRDRLRWSHGGMEGREAVWQRWWSRAPAPTFVRGLAAAGFAGLLVDGRGDGADDGPTRERLEEVLGPPAATDGDGRWAWFDLRPIAAELDAELGPAAVAAAGRAVLRPLHLRLESGLFPVDGVDRWMGASAVVAVEDADHQRAPAQLSFVARGPATARLVVEAPGDRQVVALDEGGVEVDVRVGLAGGATTVRLSTDAPRVAMPGDGQDLRLRVERVRLSDPRAPAVG